MATCDGYDDGNFRQTKHRGTKVDGDLLVSVGNRSSSYPWLWNLCRPYGELTTTCGPFIKVGVPEPATDQMRNSFYLWRRPLPPD